MKLCVRSFVSYASRSTYNITSLPASVAEAAASRVAARDSAEAIVVAREAGGNLGGRRPYQGGEQTPSPSTLDASVEASLVADRKSTRLNSSHIQKSRMPSSA